MNKIWNSKNFSHLVLQWFDKHGRHNLPWQKNISPYRVWISEIMLQQTQVATVIPYFEKFIKRFPNIKALAVATLDEVLSHWSGLGYYSRGRHLHRTAQIIHQQYQGIFPKSLEQLMQLPGIGRSTAGAILSLGMHIPASILDGNVKRVLARFHAMKEPLNHPSTQKHLWQLAENYIPSQRVWDYNQGMMDLGAIVCMRSNPQCHQCPLQKNCKAYQLGVPAHYPIKSIKQPLPQKSIYMLLLQKPTGELLLEKRPPVGIWGGLWSLPECPLENDVREWCRTHLHLQIRSQTPWASLFHTFTHFKLEIKPLLLQVKVMANFIMDFNAKIWYKLNEPPPGGIATPVRKLLKKIYESSYFL